MDKDDTLYENGYDVAAKVVNNIGSASNFLVPVVGSVMAELLTTVIPNQRLDRVVDLVRRLDTRLTESEQKLLYQNKYFVDLMEDAVVHASKSLSDNRNQYLAVFLEQNKNIDENDHSTKKKLLHILQELTDLDVEILKHRNVPRSIEDGLNLIHPFVSIADFRAMTEEEQYKYELDKLTEETHMEGLLRIGLVDAERIDVLKAERDHYSRDQIYDERTGLPKVTYHNLSDLGRLLLISIGEYEYTDREKELRSK